MTLARNNIFLYRKKFVVAAIILYMYQKSENRPWTPSLLKATRGGGRGSEVKKYFCIFSRAQCEFSVFIKEVFIKEVPVSRY